MSNQQKPKFSIVIPTYNRADLLDKCLQSLVAQTFKSFEVIVCDNGSTDHTQSVVNKFRSEIDIQYFLLEPSGGPGRPRNVGIQKAKADWICFLDSDDWWKPNKLEIIDPLTQQFDFIYHPLQVSDGNNESGAVGTALTSFDWQKFIYLGNPIPCSAVSFRRSYIDQVGLHDESPELKYILDFDFWIRFLKLNARIHFVSDILGYYYVLPGHNLSTNEFKNYESHVFLFKKYESELTNQKIKDKIKASLEYRKVRALYKTKNKENVKINFFQNVFLIDGLKTKAQFLIYNLLYTFKIF